MSIRLFPHNSDAYASALSLIESKGKAAIIHPTGTGKSFIGFKLAEEHPNSFVVWLTPSEYIVKTQKENLVKEGGVEFDNITFITYAKLMIMNEAEISELEPEYVIMDEFHRGGAACWNKGIQNLLKAFPQAKLLGLSATNIRYLDNQRNMADELFDGNIASEMTLGEAIVRGILLPPTYVISVYGYQKELERYEERVEAVSNEGIRNKNRVELNKLRRALEMADGLEAVFAKHMTNKSGKYIVFCSNRNHLDEMESHAKEWFGEVDLDMHIYKVYSDDPTASREFLDFKKDESEHLKLLFCIDMLNEGVHVNDIDGVILFRPTVSPIIYKQQIGRALSANKNRHPVIFDVVNNFENLYSISTIQEEINLAVSYYRSLGMEEKIICDTFEIIDETRDCRKLFEGLEGSLSSTWDTYFSAAKDYYEEHGNLKVPKNYITDDGLTLGVWILTQRRVKRGVIGGIFDEERIAKLNSISMVWENIAEKKWEEGFAHAKGYYEQFGNLDVQMRYESPDGFRLGVWINTNKTWYKNNGHRGLLDDERIARLNEIGMVWSHNNAVWEKQYMAAAEYYKEHGDLNIPVGYVTDDGIRLGAWINCQKNAYEKNKLTQEQIERLEMIGMQWLNKHDIRWMAVYLEATEYYRKHNNLNVPFSYRTKDGTVLRKWLYNQKTNKKLSKKRRALLDAIGMKWKDSWTERYELAKLYYEQHGNLEISQNYKTENNIWLGKWLYEQRKNKSELSAKQIKLLEEIGMDWRRHAEKAWDAQYEDAKHFYDKYGVLSVSDVRIAPKTRNWLKKSQSKKLTEAQRQKLNEIGITLRA